MALLLFGCAVGVFKVLLVGSDDQDGPLHLFLITVVYNHLILQRFMVMIFICIFAFSLIANSLLGNPVEGSSVSLVKLT